MDKDTYIEIAGKIADGTASEREIELYNAYFNAYQLKYPSWNELGELQRKEMTDEAEEGIHVQLRHNDDRKAVRLWPKIAVAAAAVAAIVFGVWFFNSRYDVNVEPGTEVAKVNDIAPGKNGATITLANGKVITLSDAKTGVVIGNGRIAYSSLRGGTTKQSPLHNEVASIPRNDVMQLIANTAKGQTYQFTLPDGTKVWLNADSKISFPSQFIGKERKILLEGEGYFEVAKDKAHPFVVATDKQELQVLGTHFNINAYTDEPDTKTTLLEGSVSISSLQGMKQILKPNEQSILNNNQIKISPIDAESEIAWKNGNFIFNDEDLQSILRKVARWYNVEVVYQEIPQDVSLLGAVSRTRNVSAVLKALEQTGKVHFKIEGRRITVMR